jgi:hypothetical protein
MLCAFNGVPACTDISMDATNAAVGRAWARCEEASRNWFGCARRSAQQAGQIQSRLVESSSEHVK